MDDCRCRSRDLYARRRNVDGSRGTRELDLIFGTFADAAIETLDEGELDDYERLLNLPDTDLMDWMLTGKPVPADIDNALIRRILAFRQNMPF